MDDDQSPTTSPLCTGDDSGYYSEGAFKDAIGTMLETSDNKLEPIQKSDVLVESPTNGSTPDSCAVFIQLQPADATIVQLQPPDDLLNHAADANSPTISTSEASSGETTLSISPTWEPLCDSLFCNPWDCKDCNEKLIDCVISYENM